MKEDLKKLYDQRASLISEMKSLNSRDGQLTAEDQEKFEKMDADFDSLTKRIQAAEKIEKQEIQDLRDQPDPVDEKSPEKREMEIFEKYIRYGIGSLRNEEHDFMEKRAQSQGTTTAGGYLVPTGFSDDLEKTLADYNAVIPVAQMYPTVDTQDIEWPTIDDTSNTGSLEGEGDALATTDLTFGQVVLYAYIQSSDIVKTSRKLLLGSAFNFELMVGDLLAERIGRGMNALLTTGTGSSQPQGIITGAGAGATAAGAAAITANDMIGLFHSVDPAYRRAPKCGWMFNDATASALRKIAIGSGDARGLWEPALTAGDPDRLLGKPITINPDVANIGASAKSVLFGDMNKYVVRVVNGIFMQRLDELYAGNGQVGFVGLKYFDGKVLNSSGLKVLAHPAS